MRRQTKVEIENIPAIGKRNKVMFLGSCFSTEIGERMSSDGYDVILNPFGILFNPASIASSVVRMESRQGFTLDDVIISDGRYTSFFHHSHFSKPSEQLFLDNANEALQQSADDFNQSETIIITFGTAWVFRHLQRDIIVSNCHKIPSKEFHRERLQADEIVRMFSPILERHQDKKWVFTVSPIRHLSDGSHGNQISKATLLLSIEQLKEAFANVYYFPSYEIMMDELRDFSFYAEDTVHPSLSSIEYIYSTFLKSIR